MSSWPQVPFRSISRDFNTTRALSLPSWHDPAGGEKRSEDRLRPLQPWRILAISFHTVLYLPCRLLLPDSVHPPEEMSIGHN